MIGRIFFELAQWSHHDNSMLVMMIHMCRSHEKPLITNKKQVYWRTYASPSDCPYNIAISLSCMSSRLCALHYVTLILGLNPVQLRRYVRAKLWRLCIPTYSHSFWLGADCYHIVAATNLRRASAATGERRIETGYGHIHHNDVIMSAMAPQITIVYSTVRRSKKMSKLRVTGLCEGNLPVTGEFPSQRASNADNVSIWWRHHGCFDENRRNLYVSLWN